MDIKTRCNNILRNIFGDHHGGPLQLGLLFITAVAVFVGFPSTAIRCLTVALFLTALVHGFRFYGAYGNFNPWRGIAPSLLDPIVLVLVIGCYAFFALLITLFLARIIGNWIFLLAHPEVLAGVVTLLVLAISAYLLTFVVEWPCFHRIAPLFNRDRTARSLGMFGLLALGLMLLFFLVAFIVSYC